MLDQRPTNKRFSALDWVNAIVLRGFRRPHRTDLRELGPYLRADIGAGDDGRSFRKGP